MKLEEAINQCELYVQAEARISLVDTDQKGHICFRECDTSAIKRLLTYIKEESIPKAVVEEKENKAYGNDTDSEKLKWSDFDLYLFQRDILQEILNKGE